MHPSSRDYGIIGEKLLILVYILILFDLIETTIKLFKKNVFLFILIIRKINCFVNFIAIEYWLTNLRKFHLKWGS